MISSLIGILTSIAPNTAELLSPLLGKKLRDQDVLLILLAVNIEQIRKLNQVCEDIAELKANSKK